MSWPAMDLEQALDGDLAGLRDRLRPPTFSPSVRDDANASARNSRRATASESAEDRPSPDCTLSIADIRWRVPVQKEPPGGEPIGDDAS